MCVNVIRVSIHLGNWPQVISFVNKASATLGEKHSDYCVATETVEIFYWT